MALVPSQELLKGIEEFNAGQFYRCHETLEELWLKELTGVRKLYQGILQIGVGFYHLLECKNFTGATALLKKGIACCFDLPAGLFGIDISRFVNESRLALEYLEALGPEHLIDFDPSLIPRIYFEKDYKFS